MIRLPPRDRARADAVARQLAVIQLDDPQSLQRIADELRVLLRADVVHIVEPAERRAFVAGDETSATAERHALEEPRGWLGPVAPPAAERNRVVADTPISSRAGHVLRVLVCEDTTVLGWVGVSRRGRFEPGARALLEVLLEPLQRRLAAELALREAATWRAAFTVALGAIPTAAFLVSARGIRAANRAGLALQQADPHLLELELRSRSAASAYSDLRVPGNAGDLRLAVRRAAREEGGVRAAERWGLTPRQAQVLALLAEGRANKTIAATLCCSLHTIEIHVSAVLRKAGVESRAELLAALWASERGGT